jgi:hypothetical protein
MDEEELNTGLDEVNQPIQPVKRFANYKTNQKEVIEISDPTSTFNQSIMEASNIQGKPTLYSSAVPRQATMNPEELAKQTMQNFEERTLSENRQDFYGNPLDLRKSWDSFWLNWDSFWLNITNNSFTRELIRDGQDAIEYDKLRRGFYKKEDLIFQEDVDKEESLKDLGLTVPETGWTPKQFTRMIEYSQDLAKQDELNRVKGMFGKISEFGLNILPYINPYTAIPFALVSDPLLAPLSLTPLALARTTTGLGKVAVAGGIGGLENAGFDYVINEYTENRKFQATGKVMSQQEKIQSMVFAGITGGVAIGGFQAISNLKDKDALNRLKEAYENIFSNFKGSSFLRKEIIQDLKNNGIANPETIVPIDKSTKADKFDTTQDIAKLQTQLKKGIDLDITAVRKENENPQFLKSNEYTSLTKAFDFFKTEVQIEGKSYKTDYEIVDLSSITPSHDFLGNEDASYPKQYQPRDRSTPASRMQIEEISNQPDNNKLIPSIDFFDGSPIIDKNGFVVIGNGRSIGLKEAYKKGKAENYKQKLIEAFPHLDPAGFDEPVLIRKFRPDTNEADIIKLSKLSNDDNKLRYNVVETAKLDAENMASSRAINFYQKGAVEKDANLEFYQRFFSTIPVEQRGNFITKTGELSQAGRLRIEAGLLQSAYNNDNLTRFVYEDLDPLSARITNSLKEIAPDIIKIKNLIEAKQIDPQLDVSKEIGEAFEIYAIHKQSGLDLGNTLNTYNLYGNDVPPLTNAILRTFFKNEKNASGILSQSQLNAILDDFVSRIQNSKTSESGFEFASNKLDPLDILQDIKQKRKPDYFPVQKEDYTFEINNYKESAGVSHEEIEKTFDEKSGDKEKYRKTLSDDEEIEKWNLCNNFKQ